MSADGRPQKVVFRLALPRELKQELGDLSLTQAQAVALTATIWHVDEDLKTFRTRFKGREPRPELVRRLRRMAKVLGELQDEIRRQPNTMSDFLPFDTLEAIGEIMSFSAMEAALGKKLASRDPEGGVKEAVKRLAADASAARIAEIEAAQGGGVEEAVKPLVAGSSDVRIAEIEARFDYQRKALGLKHGPELLAHLVDRITRPIQVWLELDRRNRGGRPSDLVRDYVLIRLLEAAPEVLGSRATATAGGKFVRLCTGVFNVCGLSTDGLEKAVERILKQRRTKASPKRDDDRTS
jgi:hypothetical protein